MTDSKQLADWLVKNVPPVLQRDFERTDLCVLATRIGFDVCGYFGVDAKPVVVRTIAYNEIWRKFAEAHPELMEEPNSDAWTQANDDGAYAIAIDETDRNELGRFAGHLVLYLPGDEPILADLSLRQFARPGHGIGFPDALALPTGPDFLDGEPESYRGADGSEIAYMRRTDHPDFRRGGDWRRHNTLSGELIRKARAELQVAA